MAVAAVDAVVADVVRVAELDRLLDVFVGPRDVARSVPKTISEPDEAADEEENPARLTLERKLALRSKICGIVNCATRGPWSGVSQRCPRPIGREW